MAYCSLVSAADATVVLTDGCLPVVGLTDGLVPIRSRRGADRPGAEWAVATARPGQARSRARQGVHAGGLLQARGGAGNHRGPRTAGLVADSAGVLPLDDV